MPNYWAYADRFVLADHFFTPMYGPTLPEHLYAVAAQSNFIVDNKSTTDHEGNYCDDPTERATRFVPHEARQHEDETPARTPITENGSNVYDIADFWGSIRLCFDIPVLPDQLEQEGISWKYYASENAWMNVLQMIRHVRYGPMWNHVQPSNFVKDVKQGEMPAVSWVIPPESYNEHPGGGKSTCAGRTGPSTRSTRSCGASTGDRRRSSWSGTTSAGSTTRSSRRSTTSWASVRGRPP